jgi:hypothetical protein
VAAPPRLAELEPFLVPAPRSEVEKLVRPHQSLGATGVGRMDVRRHFQLPACAW